MRARRQLRVLIAVIALFEVSAAVFASPARPGNYTDYRFDQSGPFFNFDVFVTWEVAPPTAYIYPAFTFGFQASQGGYMGTQLVGKTKKVIFSIWDISEDAMTAEPNWLTCRRFGGEGTGAQCIISYNWVNNREYRLRIWTAGSDSTGENWIATIYDTQSDDETTIGVIHLKNSNGYTGYGWLTNGPSIFLEYFGGPDACVDQPYSRVTWRGPYANAAAYTATVAQVPFYPNCSTNNVLSSSWLRVTHEAGDDVQTTTPAGTSLWASPSAGILRIDVDNNDDDTLMVTLLVDDLTYSVKSIPGNSILSFGEFTMAPGVYDIEIRWTDPATGTPQTNQETVSVSAGDTTVATLYITPTDIPTPTNTPTSTATHTHTPTRTPTSTPTARVYLPLILRYTEAPLEELFFDDGSAESGFVTWPGGVGAVRFTVPSPRQVKTLKYFVFGQMKPVRLHVCDASWNSIYSTEVVPSQGWFERDVSDEHIIVNGDFFVVFQWPTESPNGPWLGLDKTPPHHYGRSYLGNLDPESPPHPIDYDEDYMIRVVVQSTSGSGSQR